MNTRIDHGPDTLSATTALVGSLGLHATEPFIAPRAHGLALSALRSAQVELYCDHDAAALIALREARRSLLGDLAAEAVALASMDAASWHIRRHELPQAQMALAQARQWLM